jgi:muramoyltetrapeptide carboxypeptidase
MNFPAFLKPGDTVAITAPASRVQREDVRIDILQSWGFKVKVGATVGSQYHNFSAPLPVRQQELQGFLDDPEVKCIFAARGGYGVSDLLDQMDWSSFLNRPKWLVGFSDVTALLCHIQGLDVACIHGPMAKTLSFDPRSNEALLSTLTGNVPSYGWETDVQPRPGIGQGIAVGGNLVLLSHIIGSASEVDFQGKILFIEEVGEQLYNIDRMMVQLKRAGKLIGLAGIVLGSFTEMGDLPFGKAVEEIVLDHTRQENYPVASGFTFGHDDVNLPIVMGLTYKLEVTTSHAYLIPMQNEYL